MRDSVRKAFKAFTIGHEGYTPFMYLDVKGLVTTGIGNLIDSPSSAKSLKWVYKGTDTRASGADIEAAWRLVKSRQDLKDRGGFAYASLTNIVLPDDEIDRLVTLTADRFINKLKKFFPGFDSWPADAQLGVLSMSWAMGPEFSVKYPRFTAALNKVVPDFETAAKESRISTEGNPGVASRNADNLTLFKNAAAVLAKGYDVSQLYWPNSIWDVAVSVAKKGSGPGLITAGVVGLGLTWLAWSRLKG